MAVKGNDYVKNYNKEIEMLKEATLKGKLAEVTDQIAHDDFDANLLSERYINHKTWAKVARDIHLCDRCCLRRHKKMLKKIRENPALVESVLNN